MLQEFTQEIENTARAVVNDIHTALAGEIVSYNPGAGTATVKPCGSFVTSDGKSLKYPTITEAPVIFPFCQSAGVGMAYPVKAGDSCIIIISEVELDSWRSGGGSNGSLRFDLTSAMVIPGLLEGGCQASQKASQENAVIITAGDVTVKVSDNGCKIDTGSTILDVTDSGVSIKGNVTVQGTVHADNI